MTVRKLHDLKMERAHLDDALLERPNEKDRAGMRHDEE